VKNLLARTALFSAVLFLVLTVIFALARIIPGDPAIAMLGPDASREQIAMMRTQLALDRPLFVQFAQYLGGVLTGDLGNSVKTGRPVTQEILARLPATLELAVFATLLALLIGIPVGVLSALVPNTWLDHLVRVVSLVGVSAPAFLLAVVLQLVFAIGLGWLPVSGRHAAYFVPERLTGFAMLDALILGELELALDALRHVILPTLVLAAFLAATLGRYVRASMLEVMSEDYVRTARAKGVGEFAVVFVHALRNAVLPAITVIGLKFAELLGGAILTETIFAWPGIGRFMFEAIKNRDYPVIQGTTLVFALLFMAISLLVDAIYAIVDPRLRRRLA
jgi:peptide/nickel transport system permease protein